MKDDTMKLTQHEKRLKIAEACGWKYIHSEAKGEYRWYSPDGHNFLLPPDYFNDLDACRVMEESTMNSGKFLEYCDTVRKLTGLACFGAHRHASADACAEAFGLALNLWEAGE